MLKPNICTFCGRDVIQSWGFNHQGNCINLCDNCVNFYYRDLTKLCEKYMKYSKHSVVHIGHIPDIKR